MTPAKRLFDIALALLGIAILAAPMGIIAVLLLVSQGRPVFYRSQRMTDGNRAFRLWKFRTMALAPDDSGVSGGDKEDRITGMGRALRKTRLDEAPQLWNILRGEMSFVGPRPPLRSYVDRFPALYAQVLQSRSGLTGLATLHFHRHEQYLLSACLTAAETDAVYARRCVQRKARLDLIYQRRRTVWLDAVLLARTVARMIRYRRFA